VTEDGYAFRVDLRLRPDRAPPRWRSPIEAAAIYYENMGQNWERAAMIKARPAAGDLALGAEFLDRLKSYIWRKYLDFAAIADVQSLKRQIHAVKGHGSIAVRGHNIKLGRGGIREVEFFVQTQQLIAGAIETARPRRLPCSMRWPKRNGYAAGGDGTEDAYRSCAWSASRADGE
jgi:glutamate-ammonia-ligase adenylyltransferase